MEKKYAALGLEAPPPSYTSTDGEPTGNDVFDVNATQAAAEADHEDMKVLQASVRVCERARVPWCTLRFIE